MAGIYLHIPFCKQACHYCDFHFSTRLDLKQKLVECLAREIELQKDYLEKEAVETIYFGGGTPSLLSEKELAQIFDSIFRYHYVAKGAEITLEANPDDLSRKQLLSLKTLGINRLSVGIQSFHDATLMALHRAHTSAEAKKCIREAQDLGLENISIDLIYSIPGQDDDRLLDNLREACELQPLHISTYSLTVEEKTVFGKWNRSGKFIPMAEDSAAHQFELVMDSLMAQGFEHYEISNFAKPGKYSRHNTSYWQRKKYLGIGPSAHSFDFKSRQFNIANNPLYIKSIDAGIVPGEREVLSRNDQINEYIFTTLRTQWGTDLHHLLHHHQFDLRTEVAGALNKLITLGLLTIGLEDNTITLTRKGKLLADQVAADLFV